MPSNTQRITIPTDLKSCQALLEQLAITVDELTIKNIEQTQRIEELQLAYAELLQGRFQRRSERYIQNPDQLRIDFNDTDDAADAAEGLATAVEELEQTIPEHQRRRPQPKPRNDSLFSHLPRYEVEADTPPESKHCPTHGERTLIGYDTTETLEFERPKLRVRVTKYPKYACANATECGVASPERPQGLVEGNRYDTSVAAEVITAKYGFHLPIYRQQDMFAGSGWTPARSTLINILVASAIVLRPLIEYFKQEVLASGRIGTDDTRLTLLLPPTISTPAPGDPKSARIYEVLSEAAEAGKRSVSGRMWAYRSITIPLQVFDFTVSHHRDGPDQFLENYQGVMVADCYSGYQHIELRTDGAIRRAACVAHARRKVFEARKAYPLEGNELLARFQQLYDIEDRAKSFTADERLALRQAEATPIWQAIDELLQSDRFQRLTPKSDLAQAVNYLRNHWNELRVYLDDGLLPMDNNEVEQLMKQVAIGRKNWLFCGSVAAGERAADLLTLTSSAIRNQLDVWAYIKDVLDQLLAGQTDYASLRPDRWAAAHPEAIRVYRKEERRDRADRTQRRRAARRLKAKTLPPR
jgi:transposase